MNIQEGYKIDEPDIFITWDIDEETLTQKLKGHDFKHVTTGYYTISCKSLNGLKCMLGLHFEPRKNGNLNELEFFRTDYSELERSFNDFQSHFENEFGKPTSESIGNEGFKNYAWNFKTVQIVHFVSDRFGPEEHMRIKKIKTTGGKKRLKLIRPFRLRLRQLTKTISVLFWNLRKTARFLAKTLQTT